MILFGVCLQCHNFFFTRLTIYDDNHALSSTAVRANAKIEIAQFFNKVADNPIFNE